MPTDVNRMLQRLYARRPDLADPASRERYTDPDGDYVEPRMTDVFTEPERADIERHKPEDVEDVEDVEVVHRLSPAFGAIERGINEAKRTVESIDGLDREMVYQIMDQIADHAYEAWRHIVYGEPMVRWKRNG